MNGWQELDRMLRTDPRDAGCGETMELLHVYVELAVEDPSGAELRYPQVAAHLRSCEPCADDFAGLLAAI